MTKYSPQIIDNNLPENESVTVNATTSAGTAVLECPNAGKGTTTTTGSTPLRLPVIVTSYRIVTTATGTSGTLIGFYDIGPETTSIADLTKPVFIAPLSGVDGNIVNVDGEEYMFANGIRALHLTDAMAAVSAGSPSSIVTITYYPIKGVY